MEIVFASTNKGKIKEVKSILGTCFTILTLDKLNIKADIEETGATFEENAILKASEIMRLTGIPALADDSGLEIDFLGKRPGVQSARFLGETTSYDYKNKEIIKMLENAGANERTARFVCVMALCLTNGDVLSARGEIEGEINGAPIGTNGFGYDPVFYLPELQVTMAQISPSLKNEISHRRKALDNLKQKLEALI